MDEKTVLYLVDKRTIDFGKPIVIIQKNNNGSTNEGAVAWRIVKYNRNLVSFSTQLKICAYDSWGNRLKVKNQDLSELDAANGQLFHVIGKHDDMYLEWVNNSAPSDQITLRNDANSGGVAVHLERDNSPVAISSSISPSQSAIFSIDQTVWFASFDQWMEEQEVISSALLGYFIYHFDLQGIKTADIIVSDGEDKNLPKFTLDNIVKMPNK